MKYLTLLFALSITGCTLLNPIIIAKQKSEIKNWTERAKSDPLAVITEKSISIQYFKSRNLGYGYFCSYGQYQYENGIIIEIQKLERNDSIISALLEPLPYVLKFGSSYDTKAIWVRNGFTPKKSNRMSDIKFQYNRSFLIDSTYTKEIFDPDLENYLSAFGMDKVFTPGGENSGRGFSESMLSMEKLNDSSDIADLMRSINPIGRVMGYELSKKYQGDLFEKLRQNLEWDTTRIEVLNGCLGSSATLNKLIRQ